MFDSVKPIPFYELDVPPRRRSAGSAYPVDDAWRTRVEDQLTANAKASADPGVEILLPRNRAELARLSGVSKSTITELLNGDTNECVGLAKIHKALGWMEPFTTLSAVEEALLRAFRTLEPFGQGELLERARGLVERQNARGVVAAEQPKKKLRAIAKPKLGGRGLRAPDESPVDALARKR